MTNHAFRNTPSLQYHFIKTRTNEYITLLPIRNKIKQWFIRNQKKIRVTHEITFIVLLYIMSFMRNKMNLRVHKQIERKKMHFTSHGWHHITTERQKWLKVTRWVSEWLLLFLSLLYFYTIRITSSLLERNNHEIQSIVSST